MAILSPSILAADAMNMQKDLENAAQAGAKWLHIDVMDDTMVDWSVAGGWQYLKGTKYVFYRELGPNTPLSADIIGAISETDTRNGIRVSESINKATMANMESTTITFRASVVQSNGFENVQAAWASLQSKKEVQA